MNKRQQNRYPANQYKNLSQKNRGMTFEKMIEQSCENYKILQVGIIQKLPTSIGVQSQGGKLVNPHFKEKSTVDFMGILKGGISIAFEAKETAIETNFPLKNIKQHQLDYLRLHDQLGGRSFILIRFSALDKIFKVEYREFEKMVQECAAENRKSIPIGRFAEISDQCNLVTMKHGLPDFMETL